MNSTAKSLVFWSILCVVGLLVWNFSSRLQRAENAINFSEFISWVGIPMPPPPGMARGYTGEIEISMELAADGFLLAFFTTLIASILPAWKASRMNIVDALRHHA